MLKRKSRKVLLLTNAGKMQKESRFSGCWLRTAMVSLAVMMILPALSLTALADGATPPIDGTGYIIMKVDSKNMNVNGNTVEVDPGRDTAPTIVDSRTMIPARALAEAMGGTAGWDQSTQNVFLYANGNTVIMTLNKNEYMINGNSNVMDVAPVLINDRTLIPLRFAGEALGCKVEWFTETREIMVTFAISTKEQYSEGLNDNGFWKDIKALDYVEISDYHAMKIPKDVHQVTDDTIQAEIKNILAEFTYTEQVMNRAIKNGDTVNIDYVGSIDGVEFGGGSTGGSGTDVIIGETQYIDNFLEQLIGHKPGETVNVRVTFPKDYGEATLQGKSALFVTTINYIAETAVPELTDAFVAENLAGYNGWKTVKEMKDDIRANLQKAAIEHFITEYFTSKITIKSVPEKLVEYRQKLNLYYLRNQVESYGMGFDDALNTMGFSSIDEYFEANYDSIKNEAVIFLVFQAIAEDAGISINSKDIEEYFVKYYGLTDYSYYEENFGLPYVKLNVMYQKVLDYVIENAVRL